MTGMQGFALFRQPHAQACTFVEGEVSEWVSCVELSGRQGFVLAPFAPSVSQPVLLIAPRKVSREVPSQLPDYTVDSVPFMEEDQRADYHIDFLNFHAHLLNGDFLKLVLSRSIDVERRQPVSPLDLFRRACDSYPRVFVSLAYTPQSGLWLTATPEVMLSFSEGTWHTMALAGTMPFAEQVRWGDKNIQEQRYVASYVTRQLEQFTDDFREEGPYTTRAGHLAHLRSDFHFTLSSPSLVGRLLQALHPTPAVCGLPKQEAFRFIQQYEHHHRHFYSGFMGPLDVEGQTSLFVTLRCLQVFSNCYRLYAGGGLLKDSVEELEWQETETKLDTMRRILDKVSLSEKG